MAVMPVKYSPDSLFFQGIDQMNQSDSFFVKHAVARATQLVATPAIIAVSLLYNSVAIAVKTPLVALRYTIGFIPTENGRLAHKFPEDTTASHFAWHAYKILVFWLDALPLYPVGLISPSTNVLIHRKLLLIPGIQALKNSLERTLADIKEGSGLQTSVLVEELPLTGPGKHHSSPFEEALKQKAEEMRANKAKTKTTVKDSDSEKTKSAGASKHSQVADLETELQQKIRARQRQNMETESRVEQNPAAAKDEHVHPLFHQLMSRVKTVSTGQEHSTDEPSTTEEDEWAIPADDHPENAVDHTVLTDDISSIMQPAPSSSYFPTGVTDDLPPVQVVTSDIANSEHYQKMAKFRQMQEDMESDEDIWDPDID